MNDFPEPTPFPGDDAPADPPRFTQPGENLPSGESVPGNAPPPGHQQLTHHQPGHPQARSAPHCWKCNYELSGLGVDDLCPECGTPVWSKPPLRTDIQEAMRNGSRAQLWGILSLAFFFACIGPFAAFLTIPAFIYASKANRVVRQGLATRREIGGITAARVCSWITLSFTILSVGIYSLILLGLIFL